MEMKLSNRPPFRLQYLMRVGFPQFQSFIFTPHAFDAGTASSFTAIHHIDAYRQELVPLRIVVSLITILG
jgi:hypothetical protein